MSDSKKIILNTAIQELQKIMADIKNGKSPTFPKSLKKLSDVLDIAKNHKENEIENVLDDIAKDLTKEK